MQPVTWLLSLIRSLFCRHEHATFVRNIWGDEINFAGGKRSLWRCQKCQWLLAKDTLHRGEDGEYLP